MAVNFWLQNEHVIQAQSEHLILLGPSDYFKNGHEAQSELMEFGEDFAGMGHQGEKGTLSLSLRECRPQAAGSHVCHQLQFENKANVEESRTED